jgi:hypothetical protein
VFFASFGLVSIACIAAAYLYRLIAAEKLRFERLMLRMRTLLT